MNNSYHNSSDIIDFWVNELGVRPIPADTRNKRTYEEWSQFQDKPIPDITFKEWNESGEFEKGCAVIAGKIWYGSYKGKYLCCIDIDNKRGLDNFLKHFGDDYTIEKLAEKTIVEIHGHEKNKVHVHFIVEKPLSKKSGISSSSKRSDSDNIPAIEVKSEGKHGIMFCSPSFHKTGLRYEIIGTRVPAVLNADQSQELENGINQIYAKYNFQSKQQQEVGGEGVSGDNDQTLIEELFKPEFEIKAGNNRSGAIMRVMESLIQRLKGIYSE